MQGQIATIAVLAPFAAGIGRRPGRTAVVHEDFEEALARFGRECVLEVPRSLLAEGRIAIPLEPPDGLSPAAWLPRIVCLRQETTPDRTTAPDHNALSVEPSVGTTDSANGSLEALLDMVALPKESTPTATAGAPAAQDRHAPLLQYILAHPDYRARCAAWRGLSWLHALGRGTVRLLLADIDPNGCPDELEQLEAFLLAEEPELIIADLPLTNTPRDQATLALLARTGDQLLAPTLAWLDSPFFGLTDRQPFDRLPYLTTLLHQPQYGKWQALGRRDGARLLSTTVGRFAWTEALPPSHPQTVAAAEPLWLAPVWALAALIVRRQQESGLPYPVAGLSVAAPEPATLILETLFSEARSHQLSEARIAPLIADDRSRTLCFPNLPVADGTGLDLQLLLRSLLSWLLRLQPSAPSVAALHADLMGQWQSAGMRPPAEVDFALEDTMLLVFLRPDRTIFPGGDDITLQLPWNPPPASIGNDPGV